MTESDFRVALIEEIELCVPALLDKVQAGAVDATTAAPFAAFTTPDEHPVRTKDGIVGYDTLFEVSVYDSKYSGAQGLKAQLACELDGFQIDGKTVRHRSSSYEYYPDYDLHCWTLSFRIV